MKMKRLLSWWHLSDVHIQRLGAADDLEDVEMAKALRESMEDQENTLKSDLVFFTGDIAREGGGHGRGEYDQGARDFFNKLISSLNISEDCLFVVPGNHDFNQREPNRPKLGDLTSEYADRIFADPKLATEYYNPLRNYNDWCRGFFQKRDLTLTEEHPFYIHYHKIKELDLRVAIVGLNTVLNSYRRQDGETDQGHVVIGHKLIDTIIDKLEEKPPDLTFFLGHYPLNWISEKEGALHVGTRIRENSDFYLGGHVHEYGVLRIHKEEKSNGLCPFFEITSGALSQKEAKLYPNTAIFGSLSLLDDTAEKDADNALREPQQKVQVDFRTFTYFTGTGRFERDTGDETLLKKTYSADIMRNQIWYSNKERELIRESKNRDNYPHEAHIIAGDAKVSRNVSYRQEQPSSNEIEVKLVDDNQSSVRHFFPDLNGIPSAASDYLKENYPEYYKKSKLGNRVFARLVALPRRVLSSNREKLVIYAARNPPGWGFIDAFYQSRKDFREICDVIEK